MPIRIHTDFNLEFEKGKVWITQKEKECEFKIGMVVILHETEFEVDAILNYDEKQKRWYGIYDIETIRYHMLWDNIRSNRWKWGANEDIYIIKTPEFSENSMAITQQCMPCFPCPHCLLWTTSGYDYPFVNIQDSKGLLDTRFGAVSTVQEFEILADEVRKVIGEGLPIPPGATLKPNKLLCNIKFPTSPFTGGPPYIVSSALDILRGCGLNNIQAVKVEGKKVLAKGVSVQDLFMEETFPNKEKIENSLGVSIENVYEVVSLPLARIKEECFPDGFPEPCTICGRRAVKKPKEIILDADYVPRDVHFFKARNYPYMTFVTESLVQAARKHKLDEGISFEKVKCR